jgi:hypothetical protein
VRSYLLILIELIHIFAAELSHYRAKFIVFGMETMDFDASRFGKFSAGLVVIVFFSMTAFPAFSQQEKDLEEVCQNMVLKVIYPPNLPFRFSIKTEARYTPGSIFPSSYSNLKTVVSYDATFATSTNSPIQMKTIFSPDQEKAKQKNNPLRRYKNDDTIKFTINGGCGFDSSGKLVAIRSAPQVIWRSPTDFQDYGKVENYDRLVVVRRNSMEDVSVPSGRSFAVMANGKAELWRTSCRTNQVSSWRPIEQNATTTSVSKYICNFGSFPIRL